MNGAKIEFLHRGRVSPLTELRGASVDRPGSFDGGAYYSSGEPCELATQIKPSYRNEPASLDVAKLTTKAGSVVFGGMLQNEHFGHFISESLARLWAFNHLDPSFNTVVFYRRNVKVPVAPFVVETLRILLPDVSLYVADGPTEFGMLAVPQQIIHEGYGFIYGHPLMLTFQKRLQAINRSGAQKVFVSRSKLSRRDGGFFADRLLDRYLEEEGYLVIFPERLTIEEQLCAYNAADSLIFAEGSALHLFALVARPTQNVFVIWRRNRLDTFVWQIKTFTGRSVAGSVWIQQLWIPESEMPDAVHAFSLLDFARLSDELRDLGFIRGPVWDGPSATDVAEEREEISSKTRRTFVNMGSRIIS